MQNIKQISPQEDKFLQITTTIAKPPKQLWYIGKMPKPAPTVAIVGSRKPTAYGREITLRLAKELAENGVIVVSGLALGHDGLAHRGCLDGGGTTVAVLGTPIDQIYPRTNFALAQEIIDSGGAIISEIGSGEKFYPNTSFLARNRLISALADIIIVIEAGERSGTLNTAGHALEQGKDLMIVPGNITSPLSAGCNRLISQGATPMLHVNDVLEKLGLNTKQTSLISAGNTPSEKKIFKLIRQGISDGDELISKSNLSASEVSMALTMLEINAVIRPLGANNWAIK